MLGRDIAANLFGRGWSMLMSFAFVPIYLRLLGPEAYGLVGFYATLQAVLIVADAGLSWTVTREVANKRARGGDPSSLAAIVRTLEIAYWSISLSVGVVVVALSGLIAESWLRSTHMPPDVVVSVVRLMGATLALQLPTTFYVGCLNGFDRQPAANAWLAVSSTLRWAGAALVVWAVAPNIRLFFAWQVVAVGVSTAAMAAAVWRPLVAANGAGRFDLAFLRRVWPFAATVAASAVAGAVAMQVDKLLLVRLVDLEAFGFYSVAVLLAGLLNAIAAPVSTALYPRLSQAHALNDLTGLSRLYARGTQALALVLVPAALMMVIYAADVVRLWMGSDAVVQRVSLLVSLLALGNLVYGLCAIANSMLIACGRPGTSAVALTLLAALILPAIAVFVPHYGLPAAALVWLVASLVYAAIIVPIVHRHLLRGELGRWFLRNVFAPVAAASLILVTWQPLVNGAQTQFGLVLFLGAAWFLASAAVTLVLPEPRRMLSNFRVFRASGTRA